jgi:transposase
MATATMTAEFKGSETRQYRSGAEVARRLGINWHVAARWLKRAEANGELVACRLPGSRPLWDVDAAVELAAKFGANVPGSAKSGR